ncbi:hypothetical protein CPSG_08306 [Coccidioides posadasii str. Silveira]|uniref:Uncharacterized protein n=1 Tax=Coccidioides posadasii (strain RMSCC 757 / Silveira) TaxID=443226 RepID=E9DEQ6_COCPS|nr:hypothetical protein CPSG_08306 [Coccidioides posadasii str. Silveira]
MPDGICFRPGAGFVRSKSHGRKHRVRLPRRALVGSQDRAATQIVSVHGIPTFLIHTPFLWMWVLGRQGA